MYIHTHTPVEGRHTRPHSYRTSSAYTLKPLIIESQHPQTFIPNFKTVFGGACRLSRGW